MNPQELYKLFLLKVNKNDTNANIKIPKSQFVLLFNEQKNQWVEDVSKLYESSDYIEEIEELLELDKKLIKENSSKRQDSFTLPENFLKRSTGYVTANKGECKDNVMVVWFIKPKNRDVYLQNENLSPSFEYQETVAILNSNKATVFKTDFEIKDFYLSYYRRPIDIDVAGYKHIDGSPSIDVPTDLSKENTKIILNLTAAEALRNYENVEQLQLAATRKLK